MIIGCGYCILELLVTRGLRMNAGVMNGELKVCVEMHTTLQVLYFTKKWKEEKA